MGIGLSVVNWFNCSRRIDVCPACVVDLVWARSGDNASVLLVHDCIWVYYYFNLLRHGIRAMLLAC